MGRVFLFLVPILAIAGCVQPLKTYQEACFERNTPEPNLWQSVTGHKSNPEFDPVLTVQQGGQATLVYCD